MSLRNRSVALWLWLPLLLSAALICAVFSPAARAGEWNEASQITFSGPVTIPGKVLPAGTYTFQLMDSPAQRNIVEIFNKYRTKLYAIVMTIPTYRTSATGKTKVTFEERPSDVPEAIHKWFYPGDVFGQEFLYSHSAQLEAARVYRHMKSSAG